MKERFDRIGQSMECFDSCTDRDLTVSRSVEITDECPMQPLFESVVMDYSQSTTGIFVRIGYVEESGAAMITVTQAFPLDGIDDAHVAPFAEMCGLTPLELVFIVMQQAPHIDRQKLIADFRTYSEAPDGEFEFNLKKADLTPAHLLA